MTIEQAEILLDTIPESGVQMLLGLIQGQDLKTAEAAILRLGLFYAKTNQDSRLA